MGTLGSSVTYIFDNMSSASYICVVIVDMLIRDDLRRSWGQVAEELLHIEKTEEWKKMGIPSFSTFMEETAKRSNRTKSTLWRLRSAGNFYKDLRQQLDPEGKSLPSLTDPALKASPESLEILAKITRVAPSEVLEKLQLRTIHGTISRRELRDIWESYRPVLGGMTKRGRGRQEPRYSHSDSNMQAALIEANVMARVVQNAPKWLRSPNLHLYRAVHISGGARNLQSLHPAVPDLILLTADKESSRLEIHGIEVGYVPEKNRFLQKFDPAQTNSDHVWFATGKHLSVQEIERIPEIIGILYVGTNGIETVREAGLLYPRNHEEFLRAILKEVARSRRTAVEE